MLVLVAMALVSFLAATLLFSTYVGYQMRVTERAGKENFYMAESAMDQIRVGLQDAVSSSIVTAYTKVLGEYSSITDDTAEQNFKTYYIESLRAWKNGANPLLTYESSGYVYDPDVLKTFVFDTTGITVSGNTAVVGDDGITLEDVTVKYLSGGYETEVSADIQMNIPQFVYSLSNLIMTSVPDYAMIANESLTCTGVVTVNIAGNAYAGNIIIDGAGNKLIVKNGTVICNDALGLTTGGAFELLNDSILWAQSLNLGNATSIDLDGDTYVADDLTFAGNDASAILTGRYFGFGSGSTASASSAILINGKDAFLDLSSLRTLMLAGTSFVGTGSDSGSDIMTGESISVKSNQLAYLIPGECISGSSTNPVIYNSASAPSRSAAIALVNTAKTLWSTRTLASYISGVEPVYYPLAGSGQTLVYLYMTFDSAEKAAEYFKDYFAHHSDEIEKYLNLYGTQITAASTSTGKTSEGNLIYYNNGNATLISAANTGKVSATTSARLGSMFSNLRQTLSSNISGSGENVYHYIVNTELIDTYVSPGAELDFYDAEGNVVGVIVNGNYTVNAITDSTVRIVIATGNISVEREYTGLLVSGGIIDVSKNVTADRTSVNAAFSGTAVVGTDEEGEDITRELKEFMSLGGSDDTTLEDDNMASWDMNGLVSCSNWKKY